MKTLREYYVELYGDNDISNYRWGQLEEIIEKAKKEGKTNINQKLSEIHSQIEDINARIENLVLNLEQAGAVSLK